jgi:glyoxylase-like metal-dependent hydrolase (beta-lactamase superfamily II)
VRGSRISKQQLLHVRLNVPEDEISPHRKMRESPDPNYDPDYEHELHVRRKAERAERRRLGLAQPSYVVLTHWHWDHIFGVSAFEVPLFAYEETGQVMAEMVHLDWGDEALDRRVAEGTEIEFCRDMIKVEWPDRTNLQLKVPDVTFASQLDFNLGGVRCQVKHVGGDHASDASVVYVPEDKIVFLSDCLYEDLHHGPRNYTTQKLFPLIDELMRYNADYYIGGHHPEPMPNPEMMQFTELLKLIGAQVERIGPNRVGILEVLPGLIGKPLEEDDLEIVDAFLTGLGRG